MIHSSWFPLGDSAADSAGTAKLSTVLSTEINSTGNMRTTRAAQRRRWSVPGAGFRGVPVARWMLMGIVFLGSDWTVDNHNCTVRTV
ncbi:hypothetical protein GCM10017711_18920 [Paeniglutamicibacter sulfureus]